MLSVTFDASSADRRAIVHVVLRDGQWDHAVVDVRFWVVEGAVSITKRYVAIVGAVTAERLAVRIRRSRRRDACQKHPQEHQQNSTCGDS